jgi:TonB-linked SusC/RagA family outer membrane protein
MISGTVVDKEGEPLQGITVILSEDSQVKTTTNKKGQFRIPGNIGQKVKIVEETIGQKVVPISNRELDVTLENSKKGIPLGFGLSRSSDQLTAAVGVAEYGDISQNMSTINPGNSLYGRIAGLTVLENGGSPPTSHSFFIRGRETFNNSTPLVLVDGFQQPFNSISLGEIESVSILKDAASLALYGQRGANGVILIKTKRGESQSLKVNASFEQGITRPTGIPKFADAPTYVRALNEALRNDGEAVRYNSADLQGFDSDNSPYLYPDVDWTDQVLRNYGSRTNFNVTFEGGGKTARYFALINYVRDGGIYEPIQSTDDYSTQIKHGKFNFRSNLDIDITESLLLKLDVSGNLVENNVPSGGGSAEEIFDAIYSIPSAAFPVKTPDGSWGGTQLYGNNPAAVISSTGYGSPSWREFSVNSTLRKNLDNLIDGFSIETTVRYNNYNRYAEQQAKNYSYQEIIPVRNSGGEIIDTTLTNYGQNTDLNFNSGFDEERTQFNVVGKVNYEKSFENSSLETMAFFHQDSRSLEGQNNTYHRRNIAGNIHYSIAKKYFFDLTASYSGNNILPPRDQFGLFPAVSAAWLISNENFMSDISFLNRLKLRASWGKSGSDYLPTNNPYEQNYNYASGYWFQDGNNSFGGYSEGQVASSDFMYETSYKTNVGIDARLLNKLDVTVDAYFARRTNILTNSNGQYSDILGVGPPLITNGIVENHGVETVATWRDNIGGVSYSIGGTFSFSRNEIVETNEQFRPYDYLKRTGEQVGQQFGLEAMGFFEDQSDIDNSPTQKFGTVQPGDIKYRDQNGDGLINEFDEIPLGYANSYPEIYYSFSLGADYKGFGISTLFQGTHNQSTLLNTQSVFWPLQGNSNISKYYYSNRWTPATTSTAKYPRLTTGNNDNNYRPNSLWIQDKSYLKLRNARVSYELPDSVIDSWNIQLLRFYVSGMNLFTIDNIPVMDPEQLSAGYPILRSYQAGVEIEF